MRLGLLTLAVLLLMVPSGETAAGSSWSWPSADAYAPDATSAALADIGLWRAAGPIQTNVAHYTAFDVTALVKAELGAGRATFAWRLYVEAPIPPCLSQQMYLPIVDNTDPAFPATNRGATLCITPP